MSFDLFSVDTLIFFELNNFFLFFVYMFFVFLWTKIYLMKIFEFSVLLMLKKFLKSMFTSFLSFKLLSFRLFFLFMKSLFIFFLFSKFWGLFPYLKSFTTFNAIMVLSSIYLWLSLNLSKIFYNPIFYFSHLVPQKTPFFLGMFLSIIELVSKLMRPVTLSLRLSINMATGHVLLSLISVGCLAKFFNNIFFFSLFFLFLSFYFLFEGFVMVIQAFVYNLLFSQYYEEMI